jgi:hypothetical protein
LRILLDECVHIGVKAAFVGHVVRSVTEMGWRGNKDGPLLGLAQQEFDVFVTIDRNLEHQQNLAKFKIGFLVAHVPSNELRHYLPLFDRLKAAAESVRRGTVLHVHSHPANA